MSQGTPGRKALLFSQLCVPLVQTNVQLKHLGKSTIKVELQSLLTQNNRTCNNRQAFINKHVTLLQFGSVPGNVSGISQRALHSHFIRKHSWTERCFQDNFNIYCWTFVQILNMSKFESKMEIILQVINKKTCLVFLICLKRCANVSVNTIAEHFPLKTAVYQISLPQKCFLKPPVYYATNI